MTEYKVYETYSSGSRRLINTFSVGEGKRLYDYVVSCYDILYAGNGESCIGYDAYIWNGVNEIEINVFG